MSATVEGGEGMNEKADTIGVIVNMLQQMDMRELDLVWRIVYGMAHGDEVTEHG